MTPGKFPGRGHIIPEALGPYGGILDVLTASGRQASTLIGERGPEAVDQTVANVVVRKGHRRIITPR
jgi:hypothetical protein